MSDLDDILQMDNGLKFYKTDLHIHYPIEIRNESESYENGVSIENIIEKLIQLEYRLIAIGNHNSLKAIQEIREFNKDNPELVKKIQILPSIELNLKENFHLVLIFPDTYSEDQIRDLLVGFGLRSPPESNYGEEETLYFFENTKSVTDKGIDKILERCKKEGIIVIAPHSRSDKGFDATLNSRDRTRFIKDDLLTILDCEELHEFYTVSNKFLEKKIANIICSDAHKLSDIGSKATWLKMDQPRYKSLQQIIYEPKLRTVREEPSSNINYKIIGLEVDGGMLKDIKIHLNENYNSIIGGTGSGKSSIIDIFRYVFGSFGLNSKFIKITLNRLRDIHNIGTKFVLFCQKEGNIYKISREIPSINEDLKSKDIEDLIVDLPDCEVYQLIAHEFKKINLKIDQEFQPIIFGQNELLDYSFDPEDLVNMFNLKIKDKLYNDYLSLYEETKNRTKIIDELTNLNEQFDDSNSKIEEVNVIIENNQELLKEIKNNFPNIDIYNKERQIYKTLMDKLKKNEEVIEGFIEEFNINIEMTDLTAVKNKDMFKKINDIIQQISEFFNDIETKINEFKNLKTQIEVIYINELNVIYDKYDLEFKEYCKEKDIQNVIAIQEYINSQESEKIRLISEKQSIEAKIGKLQDEKTQLFNDIDILYEKNNSLFETWNRYANDFTSQMHGLTKIEIESKIDYEAFEDILRELSLNQSQKSKIISKFKPIQFVELFLDSREDFKMKLRELNFRDTTIDKIIGSFTESIQLKCRLCLEKPSVKFSLKKLDGFHPINQLSTGERCATLLNFVFCKADEPVIIDQPEDNIDYNYIKSTITILKEQKYLRQFIIVSHNQNLPVLGDADLILTMNNIDDIKIEIQYRGSLENEEIYKAILNLEGGKEAFELRRKKYQLIEI
ncbi:hypothetical protein LCGC14_1378960 [marine sediment metagenome]|uniref:Rad50/SbcC-type AAA domain-containing protein n=1 Tax=marine sediment metagenome TaxID=412755 RepID=A0A0F9N4X0_9ZZZZ